VTKYCGTSYVRLKDLMSSHTDGEKHVGCIQKLMLKSQNTIIDQSIASVVIANTTKLLLLFILSYVLIQRTILRIIVTLSCMFITYLFILCVFDY